MTRVSQDKDKTVFKQSFGIGGHMGPSQPQAGVTAMTRNTDMFRTRADGSIDTAFYLARGRRMRSEAAHALIRSEPETPRPRRGFARLLGSAWV